MILATTRFAPKHQGCVPPPPPSSSRLGRSHGPSFPGGRPPGQVYRHEWPIRVASSSWWTREAYTVIDLQLEIAPEGWTLSGRLANYFAGSPILNSFAPQPSNNDGLCYRPSADYADRLNVHTGTRTGPGSPSTWLASSKVYEDGAFTVRGTESFPLEAFRLTIVREDRGQNSATAAGSSEMLSIGE